MRSISTIPGTSQNTGYLHGECIGTTVFRTYGECTVFLYSSGSMKSTVQRDVTERACQRLLCTGIPGDGKGPGIGMGTVVNTIYYGIYYLRGASFHKGSPTSENTLSTESVIGRFRGIGTEERTTNSGRNRT